MNDRRKELKAQYKERKIIGGVYRIINTKNGRFYLNKTTNMEGSHNQFLNSYSTGICTHPCLVKEWNSFGKEAFTFEVLESWEKDAVQSDHEFANDLQELFEIWDEKLPGHNRY